MNKVMSENLLTLIALLPPAAFGLVALASWFQPGFKPDLIKRLSAVATVFALATAAIAGFWVVQYGLLETSLIGVKELGFSLRLDPLSAIMLAMIALLGFIIMKFSDHYLDGDHKQGAFLGRLAATLVSVQLLVLSGNLGLLLVAWVLTSISLHRLLVFYSDRVGAQVAAKKKFILARLGDICLLAAIGLLYSYFGSGNLEVIFSALKSSSLSDLPFSAVEGPALFLALAALLKSAQFPTHGWLIEVMETPTPVSALLHAGLLNAGPFLIIRMAFLMDASTIAPLVLMVVGGFTAVFGSVVYLTQTSVKTALGYSSIAHMGFSLMVCGLGVYPAAMLHMVAHSFYKAHAFLSSGSVIDVLRGTKVIKTTKVGSPMKIVAGGILALLLYGSFALMWGINSREELSLLIVGAVIVMGLSRIFTAAVDSGGSKIIFLYAAFMALVVTVAFFTLEAGTRYLLSSQLPDLATPDFAKGIVAVALLILFQLIVFAQIAAPRLPLIPYYQILAIHVRNGLYANALFDRLVGALRQPESK